MSLSTTLPDDLPWTEHNAFVLVDGATRRDLPGLFATLAPSSPRVALYDCTRFRGLSDVSPLLIQIPGPDHPALDFYLEHAAEEWGLLLFSAQPAHEVARHLRTLLTVELPTGQEVFLRLADAAVAQALFRGAPQNLFGSLSQVVIPDSVTTTWHRHRPARGKTAPLIPPYRLSPEHNNALDHVDRRRTLLDLDNHLRTQFPHWRAEQSLSQRWPLLEQWTNEAQQLGLGYTAELYYYANIMAWLGDAALHQHPAIAQRLHGPSPQPIGERVAHAAELAHHIATHRERP